MSNRFLEVLEGLPEEVQNALLEDAYKRALKHCGIHVDLVCELDRAITPPIEYDYMCVLIGSNLHLTDRHPTAVGAYKQAWENFQSGKMEQLWEEYRESKGLEGCKWTHPSCIQK